MAIKRLRTFINESRVDPTDNTLLLNYYNELNHRLFNNMMPRIPLEWKKLPKRVLAQAYAATIRTPMAGKTLIPNTLKIVVGPRKYEEIKLKGLIAHEMIHIFLYLQDDFKTNHDGAFEKKRKELEHLAGFPIPRDENADPAEFDEEEFKEVGIILIKKEDGRYSMGLFLASKLELVATELKKNFQSHMKNQFSPKLQQVQLILGTTYKEKIQKVARNIVANRVYSTVNFYAIKDEDVRNIKVKRVVFTIS